MQTTYVLKVTPYNGAREVEVAFGFLDPFKMTCLINKKIKVYKDKPEKLENYP